MSNGEHRDGDIARQVATTNVDPVCRIEVEPGTAAGGSAERGGTTYWFCNPGCRDKFVADPTRYAGSAPAAPALTAVDGRVYTWAFIYNALGVPIAAGVLYPLFGLLLSPIIASATMSLSSVSVVANALRLRRVAL